MNNYSAFERGRLLVQYAPVIDLVAAEYGLAVAVLLGRQRARHIVDARADLAMRLRAKPYELSTPTIGKIMDRDHTSILHLIGATKKGKIYVSKFRRGGSPCGGPGGPGSQEKEAPA